MSSHGGDDDDDDHDDNVSRQSAFNVQGRWQDLILSTEEPGSSEQPQQDELEKKKKKSRGNRKLQKYRAKLRKRQQQLNSETTDMNNENMNELDDQITDNVPETVQPKVDKRKRENKSTTGMTTSLSTISMVQPIPKRSRPTTTTTTTDLNVTQSMEDINEEPHATHKPNYLKTSDNVFKKMLSTSLTNTESIIQMLDTPGKLQYTRQYAQLVNDLFYLKLKQDFWENYYRIAMAKGIWSMKMSRKMMKENNLHRIQFITQNNIQKRREKVIQELEQTEDKLNKHKELAINQGVDIHRLTIVIPAFVRIGQRKLSADFERRKSLFQFDANDNYLIQGFYDLQPSEDKIISAKNIWQATINKQHYEEYVAILKQRIYIKRLPSSFNILDQPHIDNIEKLLQQPTLNVDTRASLSSERQKTIAQFKYDLMVLEIRTAEELVRNHTEIIVNEKKKLIENAGHKQIPLPKTLVNILNAISARQSNIIKRAQLITKHKLSFFRPRSGVNRKGWKHRSNILNTFSHILPSSPIIQAASSLSSKQLAFLANGPKYIPACQSRFSYLPIETIIEQEYQKLVDSFKVTLNDNCMSATDTRANEFFTSIRNVLQQLFMKPLSPKLLIRARYDHQMVKSILYRIRKQKVVIQKTDKSKVLHLGTADSYHKKAFEYMKKTNAYKEIENGINPYMDHFQQVITFIDPLLKKKAINLNIWKQYMRPNINTIELAYLYFIPKPHKIGTPLRPIVSSMQAAATGVSHFLDLILRPLFDYVTKQSSSFINNIHFVRRLELYRDLGHLSTTTNFITFDVTDLYTMIPREGALMTLEQFLNKYSRNGRINGMTIDILMKMARLVLDTNCFVFENKYYQQIRGGAMGSPFTMTLANIYMLKWEQRLIEHQKSQNELYGRYIDDVFMTSNLPIEQIDLLLDVVSKQDENIQITRTIGSIVEFLDVSVHNNQGQLKTNVFHKPAAELYIVPFLSDHPRRIHRNVIKGALLRAVRLCSEVKEFDKERLNIELTLLLNGYPPKFIQFHFKRFIQQHSVISRMEQLNNQIYKELHQQLILRPTRRETKQEDKTYEQGQILNKQMEFEHNRKKKEIYVSFTFESGPMLELNRELRHLWKKYYIYNGSPMNKTILKIRTQNNKSLSQLLIKQKPPRSILINNRSTNIQ